MFGLVQLTREAAVVVAGNARWMAWNLVLAMVPLVLAVRLFRRPASAPRSRAWWAGAVAFVCFLPNAPYVLTDVIHLFGDVRAVESDAILSFAVLPQYAVFMLGGVLAYVASIVLLEGYIGRRAARWARPTVHALSALGIYLGRYVRLNSWDVLVRPWDVVRAVADTFALRGVILLGVTYCVLVLVTDAAVWAWGVRQRLAAQG